MILVEVPFAGAIWALPVLSALTPSKASSEQQGRRHRPIIEWARLLLLAMRRWLPERTIVIVMDSEFAALDLLHARLYDPPPCHDDKPGRAPRKGQRQLLISARLTDPATRWRRVVQAHGLPWRSGGWIEYTHCTVLWHHGGKPNNNSVVFSTVPISWVLVR